MAYRSRRYLAEKYKIVKFSMEGFLDIFNTDLDDKLTDEEVDRIKNELIDNMKAIEKEISK